MACPVKVVTVGYQGFANAGDEAILAGIESTLAGAPITIVGVAGGAVGPIPAYPRSPRIRLPRFLPGWGFLRALRRADAMLIAGGGVVNDYWPTLIPRYLSWVVLARLLGARVVWVGVGIGPLNTTIARRLAGTMLGLSHLVAVRDAGSAAAVTAVAPRARMTIIPDPAYFCEMPVAAATPRGLGIVLRGPAPGEADRLPTLANALAQLIGKRQAQSSTTLLSMQPAQDAQAVAAVLAACDAIGAPRPPVARVPVEPSDAINLLASFDGLVSVRLHGVILAALADRPCVPIVYDRKVAAAAEELGIADAAIPIGDVSGERMIAALVDVTLPARRLEVRRRLAALRERRAAVQAMLVEALRGAG